jgi:hypothetical protein
MSYGATRSICLWKEPRVFGRVSLQRVIDVSVSRPVPQVERQERETETLVLRDVTQLVAPHRVARLGRGNDDVPEGDRAETPFGEDQVRQASIAYIQEAPVAAPRQRSAEDPEEMADRVSVMRGDRATKRQGIDATTSSTAASTRAAVVRPGSNRSVI